MVLDRVCSRLLGALSALLATAFIACAAQAKAQIADPVVPGEILVRLTSADALPALLAEHQLALIDRFGTRPIFRLRVIGGAAVADKLKALRKELTVLDADANVVHQSPEARKNNVFAIGTAGQYVAQWAPLAMRLAQAQQVSTGAGVRVAVLDTGVDLSHPALAGRLLPGFDFVDFDADSSEVGSTANAGFGHGTHVAGLVALTAPDARIMPLRVLDPEGRGDAWVLGEALMYAIDPDGNPATDDGVHVVNFSVGSLDRTQLMDALVALASCSFIEDPKVLAEFTDPGYNGDKDRCTARRGTVVVAAAGNGGSVAEEQYPGAEGAYGLVPVAASSSDGRIAPFSNRGSWIEIAAPGDGITSTVPGGYGTWSGTSMAAPLVAGTAALVRAARPDMTAKELARHLERSGAKICNAPQLLFDAATAVTGAAPINLACPK